MLLNFCQLLLQLDDHFALAMDGLAFADYQGSQPVDYALDVNFAVACVIEEFYDRVCELEHRWDYFFIIDVGGHGGFPRRNGDGEALMGKGDGDIVEKNQVGTSSGRAENMI